MPTLALLLALLALPAHAQAPATPAPAPQAQAAPAPPTATPPTATPPTATPPAATPPAQPPAAEARRNTPQQERMRTCAATAKEQSLEGDPRRAFMRDCLAGKAGPSAPAPTATAPARPTTTGNTAPPPSFPSEAAARTGCGGDEVVWGTGESRIFHISSSRLYGKTRSGTWMCRLQAELSGYREGRER